MSSYIEVKNVSKSFSGRAILQNISLSVEQGTTVGLVGANGSGKSVLFKIICGFEKPDQGSVYVRGRQIGKNGRDFPADMGVFINSPGFIGIYSGFQNLKFLADIQGKIGEKEIRQAMSKVGLDPDNKEKVDNYSLGMKQKLGLAQAIMEGQDILILDEPFNALDYKTYEDVKAIIRMLKAEGMSGNHCNYYSFGVLLMAASLESRGNRMKKAFFLGSLLVIGIFSALAVRAP